MADVKHRSLLLLKKVEEDSSLERILNPLLAMDDHREDDAALGDLFITVTGNLNVIRIEHIEKMKPE